MASPVCSNFSHLCTSDDLGGVWGLGLTDLPKTGRNTFPSAPPPLTTSLHIGCYLLSKYVLMYLLTYSEVSIKRPVLLKDLVLIFTEGLY